MKRLIGIMAFVSMVLTANAAIKRGQSDACISSAEREQVRPEVNAQVNAADSVMQHARGHRLSVGGYGEVAYSRNFFSDHVSKYSQPEAHRDDPSHGRFDIPHAVIYLGYDFGKGWSLGTEIEFEHGGTGLAYEKEDEEGGEWETVDAYIDRMIQYQCQFGGSKLPTQPSSAIIIGIFFLFFALAILYKSSMHRSTLVACKARTLTELR